MIKGQNFSNTPIQDIPVASLYERCTFARPAPFNTNRGHRLFPGDDTPRTFVNCNLVNCEPPPGSTLILCNTWVVQRDIPAHTEEVIVDGVRVAFKQYHDQITHGRYDPETGSYIDNPVQHPQDY